MEYLILVAVASMMALLVLLVSVSVRLFVSRSG